MPSSSPPSAEGDSPPPTSALDVLRRALAPALSAAQKSARVDAMGEVHGWDRYQLASLRGEGNLGRVWVARDRRLGRELALKELRPELLGNDAARQRFLVEARLTGGLEHPFIVRVHDLHETDRPFYTMELVKGRTLQEHIDDYHALPPRDPQRTATLRRLITAFIQVCEAIAFAGRNGVIHRDLKPANIMADAQGEACVLDWGLAKSLSDTPTDSPDDSTRTTDIRPIQSMVGSVIGTPAYMAPEQAMGDPRFVDHRTDVFGLGAILYAILTGHAPRRATTTDRNAFLREIVEGDIRPANAVNPSASPVLAAICSKAMERDPAWRYPTASELAEDVRRWIHHESTTAYIEPFPKRAARWMVRHRSFSFIAAGAVFALFLTAVVLFAQTWADSQNLETALFETARARANSTLEQLTHSADRPIEYLEFLSELDDTRRLLRSTNPADAATIELRRRLENVIRAFMKFRTRIVTIALYERDAPTRAVLQMERPFPASEKIGEGAGRSMVVRFQETVREALKLKVGEMYLSEIHREQWPIHGQMETGLEVHFAMPVFDVDGRTMIGATAMTVQFAPLFTSFKDTLGVPSASNWGGSVQVANANGEILSHLDRDGKLTVSDPPTRLDMMFPELAPLLAPGNNDGKPMTIFRSEPTGDLVYAVRLEFANWNPRRWFTVASAIPAAEFSQRERQATILAFVFATFIITFAAALIWFIGQLIAKVATG